MRYYVFLKFNYEDTEVRSFADMKELESFLIENDEDKHNSGYVLAVIHGNEIAFEIVKQATSVRFN